MNIFRRFQQGDKVNYIGPKFASELSGRLGTVDGFVQNSDSEVVVSFGTDDSYVMNEKHLSRFQGKIKEDRPEGEKERPKDVEVTKRRGGKRRSEDDGE